MSAVNSRRELKRWKEKAYRAGCRYGAGFERETEGFEPVYSAMNRDWNKWASRLPRRVRHSLEASVSRKFFKGFCSEAGGRYGHLIPLPTDKKVAAIICVKNESRTISKVLDELHPLPLHEIIVVINGSTDPSFERVREHPAAPVIIHYDEPLGHDVGRSIGAKASQSDILLFLDGDTPVSSRKLLPFIKSIDRGADVALNDISPFIHRFHRRDTASVMKEFVNRAMGRSDLMANSMAAVPHALSRKAAQAIGIENLSVPPLAQLIAIRKRLKIKAPASVNVVRIGRSTGGHTPLTELVIGDHLEALHEAMSHQGNRLHFRDHMRKRHLAGG